MALLDSVYMNAMQSALNASLLRQQVYANNIANVNTPGYKREQVHFESLLQSQLGQSGLQGAVSSQLPLESNNPADLGITSGQTGRLGTVAPVISTDTSTSVSTNGNNVNVDAEMSALAQNQVKYGALVQDVNDQFSMLRTAILGS